MEDKMNIRCTECDHAVDEFAAIAERWGYWSDGTGELLPLCPPHVSSRPAPPVDIGVIGSQ